MFIDQENLLERLFRGHRWSCLGKKEIFHHVGINLTHNLNYHKYVAAIATSAVQKLKCLFQVRTCLSPSNLYTLFLRSAPILSINPHLVATPSTTLLPEEDNKTYRRPSSIIQFFSFAICRSIIAIFLCFFIGTIFYNSISGGSRKIIKVFVLHSVRISSVKCLVLL